MQRNHSKAVFCYLLVNPCKSFIDQSSVSPRREPSSGATLWKILTGRGIYARAVDIGQLNYDVAGIERVVTSYTFVKP